MYLGQMQAYTNDVDIATKLSEASVNGHLLWYLYNPLLYSTIYIAQRILTQCSTRAIRFFS